MAKFKKGQSGNPKGRPKGALGISTIVDSVLNERVPITEGGRRRTITAREAIVLGLRNDALRGNQKSRITMINLAFQVEAQHEGVRVPSPLNSEADAKVMARFVEKIRKQIENGKK